ncbi:right-handed parallel beta-helix repeat-containing protein [Paenibacillus mesophilus]|uniref:right-handed parallel beta-helix repeat-containing protein n=1 Tax=Paenibacillus mesophilus TaxID=2582849 RepID=UPI0013051419|nr:right-handed parallel beta-helix repeat-containing protein [Paenibacillus mesophilus]
MSERNRNEDATGEKQQLNGSGSQEQSIIQQADRTDGSEAQAAGTSISRRKLLASVGFASVAMAAGTVMSSMTPGYAKDKGDDVVDSVYGNMAGKKKTKLQELITTTGPIVNVRDFGAAGNGTDDDTAAIRSALVAVPEGGTVFFPIGTYLVTGNLSVAKDCITLAGQGCKSKIVYTYEQTAADTEQTASLFTFQAGLVGITVKRLNLQYTGTFFPNVGESYNGKVNALNFNRCEDVLVEQVEISGFNANAVYVSGTSSAYAKRFKVHQCYLHHNRVGGVLFGYVEFISIIDCDLEYHGSVLDGGTGYGCAGSSGGMPRHIQIIGNRANYNYRKGIDLHAGVNAVIEGNICHGNRLYGIYVVGPRTGNVTIRGNFISGMRRQTIGIPAPYTWITGINFGPYSTSLLPDEYHNYLIEGNQFTDFGIGEGEAYPIYGYFNFQKGTVQIKNNIIRAGRISYLILLSTASSAGNRDTKIDVSGNQAFVEECNEYTFYLPQCKQLNVQGNQISTNQTIRHDGVVVVDNGSLKTLTFIGNHIEDPLIAQPSALKGYNQTWLTSKSFKTGNFLNGTLE